ncbi:murein hydrolase activator EnvC family protein [Novosphingobium bradum]|uniref:Murein hydrolase activator EnvC family protein n=1 Tax=Novosphingobium bradum TaxID=1737444 RepID=A0ABV7IR32_9SPHN
MAPFSRPVGFRLALSALALGLAGLAALAVSAQQAATFADAGEARQALAEARAQQAAASARAEGLEARARAAGEAAERSAAAAAAAAARIQQAEAGAAAGQVEVALIERQRAALRARLAERQQPLVRLTAALQRLARRPLLFALFRPGSVRDAMHLRAILATMVPQVSQRTAGLRAELDRARRLRAQAEASVASLRREQADLAARRTALAALEARQRLAARQTAGDADREAERALALAEQARDLDSLAGALGKAGALREALAQLPGPVLRPARPGAASPLTGSPPIPAPSLTATQPALRFLLPVQGRIVVGFGAQLPGAPLSRGIGIAARAGAQAIAPGAGRVAFAGPYAGYGQIAILDHGRGWTSLVTGLAQLGVRTGDQVVAGSPLGAAGPGRPVVSVELRHDGQPVNPLDYAKF